MNNNNIEGVDRGDLAQWAFANMYRSMKMAEQCTADFAHNKGKISHDDLMTLAGDNKWYMEQAQAYQAVFVAAEIANESPYHYKYRAAIQAVDAALGKKKIPAQRT